MPSSTDSTARGPDLDALHTALTALPDFAALAPDALALMPVTGLAHDHVEIRDPGHTDTPLLLRVPKQSQFALSARDNLTYQAACFERVAESGHGPRLHAMIVPSAALPMGALLVDRIHGRPPRLPADLPALAEAMARVHALPLPAPDERAPLEDHGDPLAGALAEIEAQARMIPEAALAPEARAEIEDELAWARDFQTAQGGRAQPRCLVLTDTHPGNFLIDGEGRAIIVDLEKALYGSPGIDLAHATVYSSTTWDADTWAELTVEEVAAFYRHYLAVVGPEKAARLKSWLLPMRRLLFLRAITWCVKWSVLHRRSQRGDKHRAASTEDWSAENSDPALIAHVAGRVADYLAPETLRRMRAEWLDRPSLATLI